MIIFFLGIVFTLCVFSMYSFAFKFDALNRTILNTPKTIFEYAVPLADVDDELYLDKEMVKEKYASYLDSVVYKYVDSYEVSYYFYDIETGGACDIRDCKGVEILFKAPISSFFNYKQKMYYEITKVING